MKKIKTSILLFFTLITFSIPSFSNGPFPPPPPSGDHGSATDKSNGGGAPLDGGLLTFMGLSILYAGKQILKINKSNKPQKSN